MVEDGPQPLIGNSGRIGDSALARRLRRNLAGEVRFDAFSRGRYSTDASHYQIEPIGVVVPRTEDDVQAAIDIAREEGVPLIPRGGGTSQNGQPLGEALVLDNSKYLDAVLEYDASAQSVTVQPGLVLDRLNARLKQDGLWFPIDPSTANRATLGGMAGNNSAGARSIRYGIMKHNVASIDAVLADGSRHTFGPIPGNLEGLNGDTRYRELVQRLRAVAERERGEMARRFPDLLRRVGGYNLDSVSPEGHNMARLLVGSEGTLAYFTRLTLPLQPLPTRRVLGVCHFPDFRQAMESAQHIVGLEPTAVELVDRTILETARDIPLYRSSMERFVRGRPDCLLIVEFAGEALDPLRRQLADLDALMEELGLPDTVVQITEPSLQQEVWEVRKAGLNIVMAMKSDGKPVSFIEDCAVRLEDLADYTDGLERIFARHGTHGTWYAHASVGCLHVRPVLNLKTEDGARRMRAIAEEALDLVQRYKGSHSGEHGDGLARSEWHERMYGTRLARAFEEVKDSFDPKGLLNPGKIVRPPRMDDRRLFRYKPDYRDESPAETALDWSAWGGLLGAVEMCNNNGACRKLAAGVMCPSFRATRDEQHVTRGRANTLRLALTGQLGRDALASQDMAETLGLCVSCKACRRECPTGVDMARMKIEAKAQARQRRPPSARERLVAHLPRYAPWAARLAPLANLPRRLPGAATLGERLIGLAAQRPLPRWRSDRFRVDGSDAPSLGMRPDGPEVVLFVDTFNTYFEPENARAAANVLRHAGYRVALAAPADGGRPLCCGRTFLTAGLINEARTEAQRLIDALDPHTQRGVPVVGLEPSCLLGLRDELPALLPGEPSRRLADHAYLFEGFLSAERAAGRLELPLRALDADRALLHGHCHQKAFDAMTPVREVLDLVPDLNVELIESSCCGMAGSFGYEAEHYEVSLAMAELSLLPAVRGAEPQTLIVADGTSCRQQIRDGTGRTARHVATVLDEALP